MLCHLYVRNIYQSCFEVIFLETRLTRINSLSPGRSRSQLDLVHWEWKCCSVHGPPMSPNAQSFWYDEFTHTHQNSASPAWTIKCLCIFISNQGMLVVSFNYILFSSLLRFSNGIGIAQSSSEYMQTVTRYKMCILVHTRTYSAQVSSYMHIVNGLSK